MCLGVWGAWRAREDPDSLNHDARYLAKGFWFLDDPDDFREIDGDLSEGDGIVVDEIELVNFQPNQVKKLFDLEETRRARCLS